MLGPRALDEGVWLSHAPPALPRTPALPAAWQSSTCPYSGIDICFVGIAHWFELFRARTSSVHAHQL